MIQTRRAEPKGRALLMQIREGAACFREAEDAKHLGQGTKGKLSGCGSWDTHTMQTHQENAAFSTFKGLFSHLHSLRYFCFGCLGLYIYMFCNGLLFPCKLKCGPQSASASPERPSVRQHLKPPPRTHWIQVCIFTSPPAPQGFTRPLRFRRTTVKSAHWPPLSLKDPFTPTGPLCAKHSSNSFIFPFSVGHILATH